MQSPQVDTVLEQNSRAMENMKQTQEETQRLIREMWEMIRLQESIHSVSHDGGGDEPIDDEKANPPAESRRSLQFPSITTPNTASKRTTSVPTGTRVVDPLPHLGSASGLERLIDDEDEKDDSRRTILAALQKGMAKPPFFEGNTGEKMESISTWWKQVGNYATIYNSGSRAIVIKSFPPWIRRLVVGFSRTESWSRSHCSG